MAHPAAPLALPSRARVAEETPARGPMLRVAEAAEAAEAVAVARSACVPRTIPSGNLSDEFAT